MDHTAAAVTDTASYGDGSMWQQMMTRSGSGVAMEAVAYPERLGVPDCAYYLRTGVCRFGMTCRFNHPPDREMAIASARMKGEYPVRVGEPECQYYLKTGTCKYGPTCKFHHPKEKAGITGRAQLNSLGYPLRPNEKECAYYLKTGQCKFGNTCKFHHPQPLNAAASSSTPVYPPTNSSTSTGQQPFTGGLTTYSVPRASFVANPRWQSTSAYAPLVLPQGLVQMPSWNTYPQGDASGGTQGPLTSYRPNSFPIVQNALQRDGVFPERPDQPECQFYMKTGDCKYGAVCKFHHPRERLVPAPNCVLNPIGLPLRPGEPLCKFYSRYGICKFGPNCKFNHPMATPMGVYAYSFPASPSSNVPMVRRLPGSPSGAPWTS